MLIDRDAAEIPLERLEKLLSTVTTLPSRLRAG